VRADRGGSESALKGPRCPLPWAAQKHRHPQPRIDDLSLPRMFFSAERTDKTGIRLMPTDARREAEGCKAAPTSSVGAEDEFRLGERIRLHKPRFDDDGINQPRSSSPRSPPSPERRFESFLESGLTSRPRAGVVRAWLSSGTRIENHRRPRLEEAGVTPKWRRPPPSGRTAGRDGQGDEPHSN
jgi:hypothetical protein